MPCCATLGESASGRRAVLSTARAAALCHYHRRCLAGHGTAHLEGMLSMVRNRQDAFAVCGAIAAILRSVGAACKLAASYR